MTKKIFAQPEMMVVHMNNNDIVTLSLKAVNETYGAGVGEDVFAPGRRMDDWDAGY